MARYLFSTRYVSLGCASHLVSGDCWLLLLLLVIQPVYNSYGGVVEDCWKSPSTTGMHPQVDGAALSFNCFCWCDPLKTNTELQQLV